MEDETIIRVEHLSKEFRLPHEKVGSIKTAIVNFYRHDKTYEMQQALDSVSFEVKRGEFFGIVGRNGSGKSTLLKLLAGIYAPTKGSIQVNGGVTPFIELGVGFNPELTGRENIFLNGSLLGFSRNQMSAMYDEIVNFAELSRFMDQKLKNYSSGMQVRLAFSIAIQAKSDILLLDEVLAVGDAAFQKKCYDYFMFLKKSKQTVVLVTHDMTAVRQYCDRAIMIEKAHVIHEGKPEQIAQAYLRLFADEASNKANPELPVDVQEENRWGTGKMTAENNRVIVNNEEITITTTFKANTNIEPPILGFSIYDSAGVNILEGNTQRMHKKTDGFKKGDGVTITWRVPNVLKDGKYTLSTACCDGSGMEFYDWLNSAATFNVDRDNPTAGIIAPLLTIRQYKIKGVKALD